MKPNDFYADSTTVQGDLIYTQSVDSLNLTDKEVDPMAAYYMGKIDKYQELMYRATFEVDSDAGIYKLEYNDGVKANWGYAYTSSGSGYGPSYPRWNNSYNKWRSLGSPVYFINSMKYYKATMHSIVYSVGVYLYDFSNEVTLGTGEHIRTSSTQYTGSFNATVNGFYEVFHGAGSWTVTINGTTYTLDQDNWNIDGCYFDVGDNKRIYVYQVIKSSGTNYNCTYYNGHNFFLDLIYSIDNPDRVKSYLGCKSFRAFSELSAFDSSIELDRGRAYTPIPANDYGQSDWLTTGQESVFGIKPFNLTRVSIQYACTESPTSHTNEYILNSNDDLIKCIGSSSGSVQVNYFCDFLAWVNNVLGIAPKWATGKTDDGTDMPVDNNSPEYLPNTAVPVFSNTDSPLDVFKRDNYRTLEPMLRPWQKYGYNINDDEFDPDDEGGGGSFDPDDDGDLPTKEDGVDTGEPPTVNHFDTNCSMTKFVAMSGTGWTDLKTSLAQAVAESAAAPTDTTKLAYKLGTYKSDGVYEAANELSIAKFIASARFYPFDLSSLKLKNDTKIINNNNVVQNLGFGYRGAVVHAPHCPLDWSIAWTKFYTIKVPLPPKIIDDSINSVTYKEFEPFTKYTLMLPYCGEMAIPAHNAIRATIGIQYAIDFNSGTCCALVVAGGGFNVGTETIGIMSGTCSCGISIAGNDAVTQGDRMAAAQLNKQSTELALARAKFDFAVTTANAAINAAESGASFGDKGFAPGIGVAQSVAKSAPDIVHSAMDIEGAKISDRLADINCTQAQRSVPILMNFGTNATGTMCFDTPTLKTERTLILKPDGYKETYGYPTYQKYKLGALSGYFECANPEVKDVDSNLGAVPTESELKMINDALRSGSYMGGT